MKTFFYSLVALLISSGASAFPNVSDGPTEVSMNEVFSGLPSDGKVKFGTCDVEVTPTYDSDTKKRANGFNITVTDGNQKFNYTYIHSAYDLWKGTQDTEPYTNFLGKKNETWDPAYKEQRYHDIYFEHKNNFWFPKHTMVKFYLDKTTHKIVGIDAKNETTNTELKCGVKDNASRIAYEKSLQNPVNPIKVNDVEHKADLGK